MTPRPTASPRYKAMAHRYAQLVAIVQPSEGERAELQRVSDEMAQEEAQFGKRKGVPKMDYELICGDAITVMKTLPSNSVQCVVSSPP